MGTLHYACIQKHYPPNEHNPAHIWDTVATFEFNKDYELFRWLHALKPGLLYSQTIENYEGLPADFEDSCCYQVFFEDDLFVDGVLVEEFSYAEYADGSNDELSGKPSERFDALIAAYKAVGGRKRIVICQDQ